MGFIQDCLKASRGLPPHVVLGRASRLLARRDGDGVQKAIDRCFPAELSDRRFEKILTCFITEPRASF
ncbi:MAG: hypothetical protein C4B58_13985 [Deltaproteobacteria bacterium]|nr:MAG: hypothetical protein C4B58_13985 [Deltaproteobacteria bacterium]